LAVCRRKWALTRKFLHFLRSRQLVLINGPQYRNI
jgi:hypothetical protein